MASLNSAEAAEMIGTDAKTLRRFMRAHHRSITGDKSVPVGRGKRYIIDDGDIDAMRVLFAEWERSANGVSVRFVLPSDDGDTDV